MGRMEQTWVETIRTRMDFSWRERAQGPTSELGTCWEVHWFLGRIEPTKRGYEAAISEIHNLDTDLKMDELPWTFLKQPWTVSNDITMKIVFKVFIEDLCQGLNQTQNLRSYGYPPVTWHGHGKYPVWPDKKKHDHLVPIQICGFLWQTAKLPEGQFHRDRTLFFSSLMRPKMRVLCNDLQMATLFRLWNDFIIPKSGDFPWYGCN